MGGDNLVVLGHDLWQRRFGSDPGIVGRRGLVMLKMPPDPPPLVLVPSITVIRAPAPASVRLWGL